MGACNLHLRPYGLGFTFGIYSRTSEEKAGIDPAYQTPFQEIATSPLPTRIAWSIFFFNVSFLASSASREVPRRPAKSRGVQMHLTHDSARSPKIPSQSGGH